MRWLPKNIVRNVNYCGNAEIKNFSLLYIFASFSSRDVTIFNHDVWLKDFLLRELTQEYFGIQCSVGLTLPKASSKFTYDEKLF